MKSSIYCTCSRVIIVLVQVRAVKISVGSTGRGQEKRKTGSVSTCGLFFFLSSALSTEFVFGELFFSPPARPLRPPPPHTNLPTFKPPAISSCSHLLTILSATYLPTPILPTCQQGTYLPDPTYQVTNRSIFSSIVTTLQMSKVMIEWTT